MKILFMGRKKYAAEMLEWTVAQGQDVVAVVTDSHFAGSPTMLAAQALGIPVISLEQAASNMSVYASYADLVISYLFWRKIKEPLLTTPRYGCVNFHPAILPDWKGLGGYNAAILGKLTEWGASAHFVDQGIDTGNIIRVFRFSMDYRFETAQSLEKKTQLFQCDLYKSVLRDFIHGNDVKGLSIPNHGGRYISKKEMLDMMRVDPQKDDVTLKCHAFWFPPYSGAYVEIGGKKYTLVDDFILSQLKDANQTALNGV